jgi:hypothetical protein
MPCISMHAGSDLPADDLDEVRSLSPRGAASDRVDPTDRAHEGHGSRPRHMVEQALVDGSTGVGCRTRRSATAVARTTGCTGLAASSPRRRNGSTNAARSHRPVCSLLAIHAAKAAPARHARKAGRPICDIADSHLAEYAGYFGCDLKDDSFPPEVRSLWRSIWRWLDQTSGGTDCPFRTGPKEAAYLSAKFLKRIGFRFRRLAHYRIRALLYAGRPERALATVTPR